MTTTTVKAGYKMTEIGLIPEDWEVKEVRDIVDFTNGKAHENHISDSGRYIVVNSKFISSEGEAFKRSNESFCIADTGTVLMVMSDIPNGKAIAKCFFVDKDNTYTVNQRICALKPKIDAKYLFYKINRNPFYLSFDDGVKQTNLKKDDVLSCKLGIPKSLSEQQAIATVLSDTDELIGSVEALIAKKRRIKEGAMQELLTGKKRLAGFDGGHGDKHTELGYIPEDWDIATLGSLVDQSRSIRYGIVQPGTYDPNGRYMIRGQDYSEVKGWAEPHELFRVSPEIEARYQNARVQSGDLIMTIVGYCGHVEVVPSWLDGANITQTTARIAINPNKASSIYCKYALRSKLGKSQVSLYMKGAAQPGLNIRDVEVFKILLPSSKSEQIAIAQILSDLDTEITALEQRRDKYKLVKQGLMQVLLTGKIRLI